MIINFQGAFQDHQHLDQPLLHIHHKPLLLQQVCQQPLLLHKVHIKQLSDIFEGSNVNLLYYIFLLYNHYCYLTLEVTIGCDHLIEEITVSGTTIISPNYPSEYESSSDCFAFIRFSADQIVSLTFEEFNVEKHSRCNYDYLAVCDGNLCDGDGDSDVVTLIGSKLCGRKRHLPSSIESTGNRMALHFHTDGSVNKSGFKIHVNAGKQFVILWIYLNCY